MNKLPENHPKSTQYYILWLISLFVFGYFYNNYVAQLEEEGRERGKTSFLVVFGTSITILPIRFIFGRRQFWLTAGLFCASGFWMIAGSVYRALVELNDVHQANVNLTKAISRLTKNASNL